MYHFTESIRLAHAPSLVPTDGTHTNTYFTTLLSRARRQQQSDRLGSVTGRDCSILRLRTPQALSVLSIV